MTAPAPRERWADADAYERYIGRWSRAVAAEFVAWLALPPDRHWVDVGCGSGALSATLLARCGARRVTGIDYSLAYAAGARRSLGDAAARFAAGDARSLPFRDASFDAAVSGLVLNFVPRPDAMLAEMARATRDGGTVAAYVWDYADGTQLLRHFWDAAVALDPGARDLDEARRFPICGPEPLAACCRAAGLRDIRVRAIDVPTVFRDFDDYWSPFLMGQGPAPGYVSGLDEARRTALRDAIRARLPVAPDGSIALAARAWAAMGRR
jgi:SAM-dependent methyltransferase